MIVPSLDIFVVNRPPSSADAVNNWKRAYCLPLFEQDAHWSLGKVTTLQLVRGGYNDKESAVQIITVCSLGKRKGEDGRKL